MLSIVIAQECDANALFALDTLVTGVAARKNVIEETMRRQRAYAAYMDAQLCGFLLLHDHFFSYPFIDLLLVHPSFRRHGIGSALMRHAEQQVVSGKIFTSTNTSNTAMQQLCERLGYAHCGTITCLDEADPEEFYCKYLLF